MLTTKETTINGRQWSVTQWPGTLALDITFSISKILGPGMSGVKLDGDTLDKELDLGMIVSKIIEGIGTSAAAQLLVLKILRHTRIDAEEVNDKSFDRLFSGQQLFDLWPGGKFVLETNFGDFLSSTVANTIGATVEKGSQAVSN